MAVKEKVVREYLTEFGTSPFSDWVDNLRDPMTRAMIRRRINRLRIGNFGDSKFIGEGIFELKINFGPGYRCYFGRDGEAIIILLCGGDKSTQWRDIKKAKEYWKNYWS